MPRIVTRRRIVLSGAVFFATWIGLAPAFAADSAKGDPQAGHALVYTCGGCHGVTGYENAYPNYHVPRIAGQNYDYIVAALTGYKKGERSHPTMGAQAQSLSDQEIRNIAAYLSSLKK
ncbi:MAG: cytochrome c [Rudaea sp.]